MGEGEGVRDENGVSSFLLHFLLFDIMKQLQWSIIHLLVKKFYEKKYRYLLMVPVLKNEKYLIGQTMKLLFHK
jgi:hypothetical protein